MSDLWKELGAKPSELKLQSFCNQGLQKTHTYKYIQITHVLSPTILFPIFHALDLLRLCGKHTERKLAKLRSAVVQKEIGEDLLAPRN